MMSNKKLIITGATGFIGLNLINLLIKKYSNLEILAIDNFRSSNLSELLSLLRKNKFNIKKNFYSKGKIKILFFKQDYGSIQNLNYQNLKKIDTLVHLASQTGVIQSMKYPEKDAEENIIKTIKLLQFLKNKGLKKVIFSSSMGVLGDNLLMPNTSKQNPMNFYAASKASVENYLNVYQKTFGIKTYILRFSNIYGKYSKFKTSVITSFIKSILKKKKININGTGNQYRDFLYAEDLAEVIDKLIFSKKFENLNKFPIHVATGKSTSINELIKILKTKFKLKFNVVRKKKNKGDIEKSFVKINEIRKIKNKFTNIEKGLKDTLNWFKNSV